MAFHAYILRCSDGSFYVGHSDDLEQRIRTHQSGLVPGYTARRLPVELVWSDSFMTRNEAFAAECKLKSWGRAKKLALIDGNWQLIKALARNRQDRGA